MFTTFCKNAIVPVVLRLALATIFIFHGLNKVNGEGTDWVHAGTSRRKLRRRRCSSLSPGES